MMKMNLQMILNDEVNWMIFNFDYFCLSKFRNTSRWNFVNLSKSFEIGTDRYCQRCINWKHKCRLNTWWNARYWRQYWCSKWRCPWSNNSSYSFNTYCYSENSILSKILSSSRYRLDSWTTVILHDCLFFCDLLMWSFSKCVPVEKLL